MDGALVGANDGTKLGVTVGAKLGYLLGGKLGNTVGDRLGFSDEGAMLGKLLTTGLGVGGAGAGLFCRPIPSPIEATAPRTNKNVIPKQRSFPPGVLVSGKHCWKGWFGTAA